MTFDSKTTYYRKAREGEAYIVSEIFENIADGGTANIHLENPTDSDIRFWVLEASVTSDGPYTAKVVDTFDTEPSGGSSVEIQNVLLDAGDSNDDGIANTSRNVDFTFTESHAVGVGGGGSGGNAVGYLLRHPPVVIENGREIVLQITNTGTSQNNYGLTFVYYQTTMN